MLGCLFVAAFLWYDLKLLLVSNRFFCVLVVGRYCAIQWCLWFHLSYYTPVTLENLIILDQLYRPSIIIIPEYKCSNQSVLIKILFEV